ncbi:hypothetical protein [Kineosporia babensis]|uniref:Uncharacterized protein n=1 Tax=Kineosporia babensis TaxID=499548 RepID=A0A9X1SY03_9ACTN|nr:hypothetical protein [Kineosporia babensis]MCD5316737.1 hypothetical protein [Kineosporia babensis]
MASSIPLSLGGRIVAVAGALFLLDTFAPWHRLCVGVLDAQACRTDNAWATTFSTGAALLVAGLLAELLAVQLTRWRPNLAQFDGAQFRLGLSGLATGLVVLQLFVGDGALERSYGIWLGLVLTAGLTYGNYLRSQETTVGRLSANR